MVQINDVSHHGKDMVHNNHACRVNTKAHTTKRQNNAVGKLDLEWIQMFIYRLKLSDRSSKKEDKASNMHEDENDVLDMLNELDGDNSSRGSNTQGSRSLSEFSASSDYTY